MKNKGIIRIAFKQFTFVVYGLCVYLGVYFSLALWFNTNENADLEAARRFIGFVVMLAALAPFVNWKRPTTES
jgi:hypothetical protein